MFFAVVSLNSIKELMTEASIMKNLEHPNVLSLLGICIDTNDDNFLKMIIPFMGNGDLKKFLRANRAEPITIEQFTKVCIVI